MKQKIVIKTDYCRQIHSSFGMNIKLHMIHSGTYQTDTLKGKLIPLILFWWDVFLVCSDHCGSEREGGGSGAL